jgi:hypothetical protein
MKLTASVQQGIQVSLVIPTYNEAKNIPHMIEVLSGLPCITRHAAAARARAIHGCDSRLAGRSRRNFGGD